MSLEGKVALVTGARGIGGACAGLLAQHSAHVVVVYRENAQAAERLIASICEAGGTARAAQCDVLDPVQVAHLVMQIQDADGRLDVLISNAAVGWVEKPFQTIEWPEYIGVVENELKAAFTLTKEVLPMMIEQQSGRLIYMASSLAMHALDDAIASSSAKGALVSFMRNIAAEYGPSGITANAIAPGFVLTETNQFVPPEQVRYIRQRTPLRRVATPVDIAQTVAFLASEEGGFITGSYQVIDGGISILA